MYETPTMALINKNVNFCFNLFYCINFYLNMAFLSMFIVTVVFIFLTYS